MKVFFRRLALYIFALWSFFPLYWLLNTSFKTSKDALARPPTFIFKPIMKNYMEVIKNNLGFGVRSWRYVVIINNGKIEKLFEELGKSNNFTEDPYIKTSPDNVLKYLKENLKKTML